MSTPSVIRDFARYSEQLPEVDPDVIETLVDFKESFFDDPDPTRWRIEVLRELMLQVLPRKVTAPDDWFATVVPSVRAYLNFLSARKRLAQGSDRADALLAEVDRIGDGVVAAARDPRNFGMAKAIFSAVGFDPSAPDPGRAAMEAFNALPDEQRAAIIDPALRGFGPDAVTTLTPPGDDPFADLDETWQPLPLTWLPPAAELAAAVRSAPLVRSLLRLAAWNGAGHKVTRQEVLPLPAARSACADLGLSLPATAVRGTHQIPTLHRLWSLATDHEILVIDGRSAVRGEAADLLTDPGHDPEAVVAWWVELFTGCLDWGLDVAEDPDADDDPDEELLDAVDGVLTATLTELYPGIEVSASGLAQVVVTTIEEVCDELVSVFGLSPAEVREQARKRWVAQVAQLVELGAAVVDDDDDLLSLTPLGRAGVRALALANGADAPLADDPATLDAAALLDALPVLGDHVAEPLLTAWSTARSPQQAMDELLEAARRGTARARMTAVTVLMEVFRDHVTAAGRPRLEALRDDPVLGLSAHVLLGPDQAPELPPSLRQWAALETTAVAVESGALDDEDTAAKVWEMIDEDGDLDSAWRSTHPQLVEILEAVAADHPRGRARKAAKKALFKVRKRQSTG